jgi:hypothetical protein
MRTGAVVLAAAWSLAVSLALAGCATHAKTLASSPQPAPLSVPQTTVTLPPPQPLNPDALGDDLEPAPAVHAAAAPVSAPLAATPSVTAPARRPAPSVAAQPPPPSQVTTPAPPPVERPAIQAVLPAQEQKRLKDSADSRKKEVRAILARMGGRRLSPDDQDLMKRVQFFLTQSDQAEHRGDMNQADVFAQRAQDLARGWQGGK